jgi:hypothetical protein
MTEFRTSGVPLRTINGKKPVAAVVRVQTHRLALSFRDVLKTPAYLCTPFGRLFRHGLPCDWASMTSRSSESDLPEHDLGGPGME